MQAIDRALAKRSRVEGIEALDVLAEKFLERVEAEGIAGFRELADRLDGKPSQQIDHGNAGKEPFRLTLGNADADA